MTIRAVALAAVLLLAPQSFWIGKLAAAMAAAPALRIASAEAEDEAADDSPEESALRFLSDVFDVPLERGPGTVTRYEDEPADQVNPFFETPIDQLDTSLPLGWDILWGDYWTVDSSTAPAFGDTLVTIEPSNGTDASPSGHTFYGRYSLAMDVDNREPLETHWCSVSLHGHRSDTPVTLPASVIDDQDPTANTNVWWSAVFGPHGETFTTKTEVNPETRVPQPVAEHSTLAVVDGNDVILMIPADELEGTDRIVMSAACMPLEYTDYGLHTRDTLVDTEIDPSYLLPSFLPEAIADPEEDLPIQEEPSSAPAPPPETTTTTTQPQVETNAEPVSRAPADDDGLPTPVSLLLIALGLAVAGTGGWLFSRSGGQE